VTRPLYNSESNSFVAIGSAPLLPTGNTLWGVTTLAVLTVLSLHFSQNRWRTKESQVNARPFPYKMYTSVRTMNCYRYWKIDMPFRVTGILTPADVELNVPKNKKSLGSLSQYTVHYIIMSALHSLLKSTSTSFGSANPAKYPLSPPPVDRHCRLNYRFAQMKDCTDQQLSKKCKGQPWSFYKWLLQWRWDHVPNYVLVSC